jgi:hypothetical protein
MFQLQRPKRPVLPQEFREQMYSFSFKLTPIKIKRGERFIFVKDIEQGCQVFNTNNSNAKRF